MLDRIRSEVFASRDSPLPPPARADATTAALFLDLDGTLLDLAARPDAVVVDAALRATLRSLHDAFGGALAIVSGRPLRGIDELTGLPGIAAAGLHGAELRHADGRTDAVAADAARLARLREHARALASELPGVLVEDKGVAIALHWRNAPQAETAVLRLAGELLREAGPAFELQRGRCVAEVKPAGRDKGDALAALMREAPFAGRRPWMLGDDLTDEHAFACANELGGVSVVVGTRRPTLARHALADPAAARAWLAALLRPAEETR